MVGRESDKIVLRVPDGMRDRIKAAAADNGRSMNAEIVATLEEQYPDPEHTAEEILLRQLKDLRNASDNKERLIISEAMRSLIVSLNSNELSKTYILYSMVEELRKHGLSQDYDDDLFDKFDDLLKRFQIDRAEDLLLTSENLEKTAQSGQGLIRRVADDLAISEDDNLDTEVERKTAKR